MIVGWRGALVVALLGVAGRVQAYTPLPTRSPTPPRTPTRTSTPAPPSTPTPPASTPIPQPSPTPWPTSSPGPSPTSAPIPTPSASSIAISTALYSIKAKIVFSAGATLDVLIYSPGGALLGSGSSMVTSDDYQTFALVSSYPQGSLVVLRVTRGGKLLAVAERSLP